MTVGITAATTTSEKEHFDRVKQLACVVTKKRSPQIDSDVNEEPDEKQTTTRTTNMPQLQQLPNEIDTTTNVTQAITTEANQKSDKPEAKGIRKIPEAEDGHGCLHCGIMNLKTLSKDDLKFYTKKGAWLENKPCVDCESKERESDNRVMNVIDLLLEKGSDPDQMARYCNYGAGAHGHDNPSDAHFACNLVLCIPCYNIRLTASQIQDGNTGRRTSARNRK